jgi:thiol:disulfide interchange protein
MRLPLRFVFIALAAVLLAPFAAFAQNPVKWTFTSKDVGNGQFDLIFTGAIDDGWYTYSQFQESEDGPIPTSFTFKEGAHFELAGPAKESGGISKAHDKFFDMNVAKFKHNAIFTQRIVVKDATKPVEGFVNYMVCNDEMCLPPKDVDFKFTLTPAAPQKSGTGEATPANPNQPAPGAPAPGGTGVATAPVDPQAPVGSENAGTTAAADQETGTAPGPVTTPPDDPNFKGFFTTKRDEISAASVVNTCGIAGEEVRTSALGVFIGGFLGGLLALLTPCVFPMVPMTVSFFVKRSKDRRAGLRNAFLYGASIVLIYVALGSFVTAVFGPAVLNEMSTNVWFNVIFFLIFVIFALSFFGLFEITLPSSWVNKSDQMADKGGLIGIFFMAFTLALVSFSCTGPIVGTLLVEAARSNAGASLFGVLPLKPMIGMFGFGLALGLPFALFAMFPGWLNSLPKSGSWMDNVKITLGIVEVALALKFLSTADMVDHWGLLRFETFLALWVALALLLGVYQLGLLPWKGGKTRPGPARAAFGLASLAFAFYLGWGLLNYQSLSLLSGLAPPVHYSYKYASTKEDGHKSGVGCPHGLDCYHDFDEGVAAAKRLNKPLFVDFTGHACVNCRKMEETVWDKPGVIEHLRDNYVVVSLYVDDRRRLFPDNKFSYLLDPHTGEKIKTVGDKWHKFQINNFGKSAQPYYVLMDNDGKTVLNQPVPYTPDVDTYKAFLDCGYEAFKQVKEAQGRELIGGNE